MFDREYIKLLQELDILNPNWKKEIELTELSFLKLLREVYSLGAKPNELYKLLEINNNSMNGNEEQTELFSLPDPLEGIPF